MTPLIFLSLMSLGFVGLLFESQNNSESDENDLREDENATNETSGYIQLDDTRTGVEDIILGQNFADKPLLRDQDDIEQVSDDGEEAIDGIDIQEADQLLIGTDGDDYIRTSTLPDHDGYSNFDRFEYHLGAGGNSVWGGGGNDTLEISAGDFVAGGEGMDKIILFSDPFSPEDEVETSYVDDFSKDDDIIFIQLPPTTLSDEAIGDLHNEIEISVDDENSYILINGKCVLSISGQVNLNVGVLDDIDSYTLISEIYNYSDVSVFGMVDPHGNAVVGARPDIIIGRYQTVQ